jgi:putative colanic acid biosynthesis glycosyltransferase
MTPTVSIITVAYNAVATLERTIRSILNQQGIAIDYIVIDGGSGDGTVGLLQNYSDRLAYWVSEPDGGVYEAMNKGLTHARGDWVLFMGADDLFTDDRVLQRLWQWVAQQPAPSQGWALVFGDVYYRRGEQLVRRYRSRFDASLYIKNRLHHQGAFYHRDLVMDWCYDPSLRAFADYELNLKLYLQRIPALRVPMVVSDCQVGGLSGRVLWSGWQEERTIRQRYLGWWGSLPWDFCGLVRYGIKQVRQSVAGGES